MTLPVPVPPPAEPPRTGADRAHDDVLAAVTNAIHNQPRSLQKRIGPSEIGTCDRNVLHKLAGTPEPPRGDSWPAAVGTAVHALVLDHWLPAANHGGAPRWVTEHRVTVGHLPDGTPITGSADLFDSWSRTVVDLKVVGPRQLARYKSTGPSDRYRTQVHLYGGGYFLDPHPWGVPEHVAIWFLPRDGRLDQAHWWSEPWDPHKWAAATSRLNGLWNELQKDGLDAALKKREPCDDRWCTWCKNAIPTGRNLPNF